MGLRATAPPVDPRELERSAIFSAAQSLESFLANVELAFVAAQKPLSAGPHAVPHPGAHAMIGWVGRASSEAPMLLSLENSGERQQVLNELKAVVSPHDVVKADPSMLPDEVVGALNAAQYFFEIPGTDGRTLYGWQDESEADARAWAKLQPSSRRTMGLLSLPGQAPASSPAVVLHNVNDQWFCQSELGAYGFVGGSKLLRGEPIYFVSSDFRLFRLRPEHVVSWDELKLRWGRDVAERARKERSTLVVNLEPLP